MAIFFSKSKNKFISSFFFHVLYLLSLPFSWLHLLALSKFGSVGTIGPCSPSSSNGNKKKKSRQKSPARKQNTVIVLVNNSSSLKENLPAPLVCHPPCPPSVLVKNQNAYPFLKVEVSIFKERMIFGFYNNKEIKKKCCFLLILRLIFDKHSQIKKNRTPFGGCLVINFPLSQEHLYPTFVAFTHPLASFQNGLGCTLLPYPTSQTLLISPNPRQRELCPSPIPVAR